MNASGDVWRTLGNSYCTIDEATYQAALETQGEFFERISRLPAAKVAADVLSTEKSLQQGELLQRYCPLEKRRVLEVGSGLGVNHVVWSNRYGIDGYGVEPSQDGFNASHEISKGLLRLNGLNDDRIIDAVGESLPFPDDSFDVVYSTNVLEHTQQPAIVLDEALRVLRPGGVMQFVFPNYRSYFDGHYAVFHPPVFSSTFFPWYVSTVFRRDPAFARTLRTELNVAWVRRTLRSLRQAWRFEVLSVGDELFLERMTTLEFAAWAGLGKVAALLRLANRFRLNRVAARFMIATGAFTPIVLTLRKLPPAR